jgi:hypothetical protein
MQKLCFREMKHKCWVHTTPEQCVGVRSEHGDGCRRPQRCYCVPSPFQPQTCMHTPDANTVARLSTVAP